MVRLRTQIALALLSVGVQHLWVGVILPPRKRHVTMIHVAEKTGMLPLFHLPPARLAPQSVGALFGNSVAPWRDCRQFLTLFCHCPLLRPLNRNQPHSAALSRMLVRAPQPGQLQQRLVVTIRRTKHCRRSENAACCGTDEGEPC